jgi:hypothetical protein
LFCTIEESKYLTELFVDELIGSLLAHEQRKKLKKKETLEEALQAKVVIKEKTLYVHKAQQACGRGGRGRRDRGELSQSGQSSPTSRGRERSQEGRTKSDVDCYNCGKHVHYVRDYWAKKIEGKTNYADVMEEKVLLMAQTPSTSGCDTV